MIDFSYLVCWSEFKLILSFSSKYHKAGLWDWGLGGGLVLPAHVHRSDP